ncbi:LarC family nickel insertion protein [Neobacillus sp. NPDC097160]|uniref:LarC family nickel insertion protein n=1 Tax=Neobacillus sp. NPDC097160 TaxID=3364298 RepID=UPI0037F766BA
MKTLYFDCFSGISGDMVIGALIDAGADPNRLIEELKKLQIEDEYELNWKKIVKNGITSTKFDVVLLNNPIHVHSHSDQDDHSHDHVHGHDHHHEHSHDHEHSHSHDHEHSHGHENSHSHDHEHHHHHDHRAYKDIVKLIEGAGLDDSVKETALKIFKRIGEAEGLIHGIPLEKVHFHEVGAVDSIIDIIGAAILIHQLDIDVIKSSPIPVGTGRIHIDHGIYPVPAPATLEILKGVPIDQSDIKAELTTPTGAAIVAVLAEEFCPIPSMRIKSIGYGAGTKTFKNHPNVLRVIIGE